MKLSKVTLGMFSAVVLMSGPTVQSFAQKVLPEIVITAANYKYLNAISPEEAAQPVDMLEQYAADYDVKGAEFYEDVYNNYIVSFYIPEGKILAAYDKDGKLLRTAERYKDVAVPKKVRDAVAKKYGNWAISKDVYLVNYRDTGGYSTRKVYKLLLENGEKRKRVKVTVDGEFLE